MFPHPLRFAWLLRLCLRLSLPPRLELTLVLALLVIASDAGAINIDPAALRGMDESALRSVERQIVTMITDLRNETSKMHQQLTTITEQRDRLSSDANRLREDALAEFGHRVKSDKLASAAQKTVDQKRTEQAALNHTVATLINEVDKIKAVIANTTAEKQRIEAALSDPTLRRLLDRKVQTWADGPRRVYNTTMDRVIPVAGKSLSRNRQIIHEARKVSPVIGALASVIVYGFWISATVMVYNFIAHVRRSLKIATLLFLGDLICAVFWGTVIFFHALLWTDPLLAMASYNPASFFICHALVFVFYVLFCFVRLLVLAARLTPGATIELAVVVIAGNYYYDRVWKPLLLGQDIRASLPVYFIYLVVFANFAVGRLEAATGIPPEKLAEKLLDPTYILDQIMLRVSGARRRRARNYRHANRSDLGSDVDDDYSGTSC